MSIRNNKNGKTSASLTDYNTRVERPTLLIGLTGNIGCGKSTVGTIVQRLGVDYVDADAIVHVLLGAGTPTAVLVMERFGAAVGQPDGSIDRRALGAIVFQEPGALRDLEQILHPSARAEIRRRINTTTRPVVMIDAIKLLESDLADEME